MAKGATVNHASQSRHATQSIQTQKIDKLVNRNQINQNPIKITRRYCSLHPLISPEYHPVKEQNQAVEPHSAPHRST